MRATMVTVAKALVTVALWQDIGNKEGFHVYSLEPYSQLDHGLLLFIGESIWANGLTDVHTMVATRALA